MHPLLFLSCPFHVLIISFEEWYLHLCCMIITCQARIALLHHFVSFIFLQKVIASSTGGVKKILHLLGGRLCLLPSCPFMSFQLLSCPFLSCLSISWSCHFSFHVILSGRTPQIQRLYFFLARPSLEKAF